MKFIPQAHQCISTEDIEAVKQSLQGDWITRGAKVLAFEQAVADFCGAKYAVAFNSGTSALMAAYSSVDANANDRLITTPNTFVATAGGAMHCQVTPIFIDIDRNTGNFDLNQLKINIDNFEATRGRLIIAPVHFSGIAVDMQKLDGLLASPDSVVIEDAAHAIGSYYPDGKTRVGSCRWSHMTIFSFHPSKTITTGEGGMVTTNDENLFNRLRRYRDNGIERDPQNSTEQNQLGYYEVMQITGNYHFTEIQAALGISQLNRLDEFVAKRRALVKRYREKLQNASHIRLFTDQNDKQTAFHLFVVQINFSAYGKTRKEVMIKLKDKGIGTQVHYIPMYRHPVFSKGKETLTSYFPETEAYYSQALSLPLFFELERSQVDEICKTLIEVLNS